MATVQRTRIFQVRMTTEELEMLHELATAEDSAGSQLVRRLVRTAHAEKFGERKKTKAKR